MFSQLLATTRLSLRAAVTSLLIFLTACGGGAAIIASGGIGGTGMSLGPIVLIGSVTVNGVKYETTKADIYIEDTKIGTGDSFVFDNLAVGQVVRVVGTNNGDGTGSADAVYFNDNVDGPITSRIDIDPTTAQLEVMGQTVIVDSQTRILDLNSNTLSLSELQPNNVVEVSGLIDQNGAVRATFIRNKADTYSTSDIYDLKGIVTSQTGDDSGGTIMINNLQINYDATTELDDPDLIAIGGMSETQNQLVEVKGKFNGSSLLATRIEIENELDGEDDDEVELQGFVTGTDTDQFTLGYQLVQFDSNTEFSGGLASDITTGVHLEVSGIFQGGILMAEEIEFKDEAEVTSAVSSHVTGATSVTIALKGFSGIMIYVNAVTDIRGDASDLTSLDNLLSGFSDDVQVKARGQWDGSQLVANEIEVNETTASELDARLQGPVTDENTTLITVMDEDIDTNSLTSFEANDSSVSQSEFLDAVENGDIVKLEGKLTTAAPGTIDWEQIELEGD